MFQIPATFVACPGEKKTLCAHLSRLFEIMRLLLHHFLHLKNTDNHGTNQEILWFNIDVGFNMYSQLAQKVKET